jgi:hypothetical protein
MILTITEVGAGVLDLVGGITLRTWMIQTGHLKVLLVGALSKMLEDDENTKFNAFGFTEQRVSTLSQKSEVTLGDQCARSNKVNKNNRMHAGSLEHFKKVN